jgi:hypothetical protein
MISTGEVIESLAVTTNDNGFLSEYKAGTLTVINQIVYKEDNLAIISRYQNLITNSDETLRRLVSKVANEIIDIVDDSLIYKYDVLNMDKFRVKKKMS